MHFRPWGWLQNILPCDGMGLKPRRRCTWQCAPPFMVHVVVSSRMWPCCAVKTPKKFEVTATCDQRTGAPFHNTAAITHPLTSQRSDLAFEVLWDTVFSLCELSSRFCRGFSSRVSPCGVRRIDRRGNEALGQQFRGVIPGSRTCCALGCVREGDLSGGLGASLLGAGVGRLALKAQS